MNNNNIMNEALQYSGIKIVEIRIRNFRSLKQVDVYLDNLTVLIGENNSGKTSFLEALFAAIGAGKRVITPDDVFLAPGEKNAPKNRSIIIDILVRPTDENNNVIDSFPEGSPWLGLWGNGIAQDDNDNDMSPIRTKLEWNTTKGEYIVQRKFLSEWPLSKNLEKAKINEKAGTLSSNKIEPIALYLMDAKRDIQDELQSRSSFWHKMVSEPDLSEDQVEKMEEILNTLNEDIIKGSDVLSHVQSHLDDLYKTVVSEQGCVSITPLARHLRDLSKGMDINFSTKDAQTFPLARHGMGTRSLAAILTFRAYSVWRQNKAKGDAIYPVLALEEPEAHLHPQAQRSLYQQIEGIPGQRIISTHSPYIAGQANIGQFRHFKKQGPETMVTQMDMTSLTSDDLRKINQMVMNTRGEILYARALVFFEGETEEAALPIFAEHYWGQQPNSLGISMVPVSGNAYFPFVSLAHSFDIPWYIFSDGEEQPLKAIVNVLKKIGKSEKIEDNPNLFVISNGENFEQSITIDIYKELLIEMIVERKNQNDRHKEALIKKWKDEADPLQKILEELSGNKTKYAKSLALAILKLDDSKLKYPELVRKLFEKMSDDLGLLKKDFS